jgi:hypothetical protein
MTKKKIKRRANMRSATVANQTLEETDPALTYSGTWGSNKSPNFSGGGSTFTNADNASVSFSFHGSFASISRLLM